MSLAPGKHTMQPESQTENLICTTCPDFQQLIRFNDGQLSGDQIDQIADHLDHCDACLSVLAEQKPGPLERCCRDAIEIAPPEFDDDCTTSEMIRRAEGFRTAHPELGSELFEITGQSGQTGFFDIYDAFERKTGDPVMVKIPRLGLLTSNHHLSRFIEDATAATTLAHESIVPVLATGSWDSECVYVASPAYDCATLRQVIESGQPLSRDSVSLVCRQILSALRFAHQCRILHRHLSPDCVLLKKDRNAQVADFGLVHDGRYQFELREPVAEPTEYLSPEAVRNDPRLVDVRADIFSFGAILETLVRQTRNLSSRDRNALQMVAKKCCLQSRSHRYQSTGELSDSIDSIFDIEQ